VKVTAYAFAMTYIDLNGHETWAVVPKRRKNVVVLLHGALSSSRGLLAGVGSKFPRRYSVAAFDRRGHGRTSDDGQPLHYETMADETIAFLERLEVPCHVVGYSDGGNIALLIAMKRPELLKRMVLVGANFHYSGVVDDMMGESPEEGRRRFTAKYVETHLGAEATAASLYDRTMTLLATEPRQEASDLSGIQTPSLVVSGDDDLIRLSHTVTLYEALPTAQLMVVPGASHSVLSEQPKEMARAIVKFLEGPLVPQTFLPVRRRGREGV